MLLRTMKVSCSFDNENLIKTFFAVELGVVIGKSGRNISQADAYNHIAEYSESKYHFCTMVV